MFDYETNQRIQEAIRKTETEDDYFIEFHIDRFGVLTIANKFVQVSTIYHTSTTYYPRKNELGRAVVDLYWSGIVGESFSVRIGTFYFSGQSFKLSRVNKLYPVDPDMGRWEDEVEVLYERDAEE